jgi:magnesium chelatase subunit I
MATHLPTTLGALRTSEYTAERVGRSVKDELRENLIAKLRAQASNSERHRSSRASSGTRIRLSRRS